MDTAMWARTYVHPTPCKSSTSTRRRRRRRRRRPRRSRGRGREEELVSRSRRVLDSLPRYYASRAVNHSSENRFVRCMYVSCPQHLRSSLLFLSPTLLCPVSPHLPSLHSGRKVSTHAAMVGDYFDNDFISYGSGLV